MASLPSEPTTVAVTHPTGGEQSEVTVNLFKKPGEVAGTRRAISEVIKWMNCVTGNRFITVAADLSGSINVESGSLTGHYDPVAQTPPARASRPPSRKRATRSRRSDW